ncbi:MAG: hypothetical protein JO354_13060, partial [Verrucomicrobia bacterium]|nr:hypothetical protein [Verrucomicrobiota bacterium]
VDTTSGNSAAIRSNDTIINAEVAILQSWDLDLQVAEALGPKRVLPNEKNPTVGQAASAISSGLTVEATKGSNVILVSYSSPSRETAPVVLNELINRYFTKHLEVHRSAGAFDFVSQQTDQVRARLTQTEDALKALKAKIGVLDLKESTAGLIAEASRINDTLRSVEGDLVEQRARLKLMEGGLGTRSSTATDHPAASAGPAAQPDLAQASPAASVSAKAAPEPKPTEVDQYQSIQKQMSDLQDEQNKLLTKYTSNSTQVKLNQAQLEDLEKQKQDMEKKFPSLASMGGTDSIAAERAKLAGLEAKTEELKRQLASTRERMSQLADAGPQIANLERTRDMEETNYKYFEGALEKARIDEALDPSKIPNISAVQKASPPSLVTKTRNKVAGGFAAAGLVLGIAWAFLNEMFLRKPVNRALELENQFHLPVLLSIPDARSNGRLLRSKNGASHDGNGKAEVPPWEPGHFIRSYTAAIRDRLSLHFELHGVTHKPKLVGVTALNENAGSSTLAAGLAAALSETGDGKVLLVDVNVADGEVHPFFAGRPALPLTCALDSSKPADSSTENLYVATIAPPNAHPARVGLKRFFALMPNLKASDFDYVIFDLPPVDQTSPTIGLAGFMDKVLLVVEAEKNSRDGVNRVYRELTNVRADVSLILNKVHAHAPKWLTA